MILEIPGVPKALKRHRMTKKGWSYDPSKKDKQDFIAKIPVESRKIPLKGEIVLFMVFTMPRPKKHYRTGKYSHVLKSNAPENHVIRPDIDNLLKFVMDCLVDAGVIKDDCQVCAVQMEKLYGEEPNTTIMLKEAWREGCVAI